MCAWYNKPVPNHLSECACHYTLGYFILATRISNKTLRWQAFQCMNRLSFIRIHAATTGERWKQWLSGFTILMTATGIEDRKRRRALLLHYAGQDVQRELDAMTDYGGEDEPEKLAEALTKRFAPQKTQAFEKYRFRQARQEEGESTDRFHTRLQTLVKNCDYGDKDAEVCTQIIANCTSHRLI